MAYQGSSFEIPLGNGGLLTDETPGQIPPTRLIYAKNISLQDGRISKERGSMRWNKAALSSAVARFIDYVTPSGRQVFVVVTKDGKVWKLPDREIQTQVTAASGAPATLTVTDGVSLIEGGEESPGNDKKLFVMTGNQQVQVIAGDSDNYRNLLDPPTDLATSDYSSIGVIHQNRLWLFGTHRAYASDDDDHETFTSGGGQFPVFPGEGDRIIGAVSWKGNLFVFKKPYGVYRLVDNGTLSTWYFQKLSSEFGASGPNGTLEALDDLLVSNSSGTVTSLAATQKFGDVESGDIFSILKTENFIRQQMSPNGYEQRQTVFFDERKLGLIAFRSSGGSQNDSNFRIDFSNQRPELTITDKDQINCFAIRRVLERKIPFYGAEDNYIYEMDREDREVARVFDPIRPLAALAGAGAGNLDNATYHYVVTFADATRETRASGFSAKIVVADNSTDGQIDLTAIPIDTTLTATKRRIFRKKEGDAWSSLKLVAEIGDNTTTTYTDNIAEGSLTDVQPPALNSFNVGYTAEFQTPHMDLSFIDPGLKRADKIFDALELSFVPTGRWNAEIDYYIDGVYKETRTISVSYGAVLDDFTLDTDRLLAKREHSVKIKLRGSGETISFRIRNTSQMENFELTGLRCYYRGGNQDQKNVNSGRGV
jgi:hypothetical protein